ncbi:amidase [Naumannella halotolerans]|uniref:amidase n=1 Tax=Naumannella halotolerans TaxID=993414 RepID=UPI00370D16E5
MTSLAELSAHQLLEGFADGRFDPVQVHDAVQAEISRREPELNTFWMRDPAESSAAAGASAERWRHGHPCGPLDGVPVTVKENIARAGVPMPSGNAAVIPVIPEHDDPITTRLREAGAVILGSTVMPDWGMLSSGVSSLHGITRSPWNPAWTTGGSSSGAGAAAAAGFGPLHVGSDIGGSIRLPGTWLGLATLKPTGGLIPLGAPYLGRAAGPLTRTAEDARLLLDVLAGPAQGDWTSLPPLGAQPRASDPSRLRIGFQPEAGDGMAVDPEVAAAVTAAVDLFADSGAEIVELPGSCSDQVLTDLDRFWRVRSLRDQQILPGDRQELTLPFIQRWVQQAAGTSGEQLMDCYHAIGTLQRRTVDLTAGCDLVLSPVAPVAAFPAEWPMPFGEQDLGMAHIGFTVPYNMSGQPAGTVNCGFTGDGRPIGLQIAGQRFTDDLVLDAMAWFETHRPASTTPVWPIG